MSRADSTKNPSEVASMLDGVGKDYDTIDTVLTGGINHYWRVHMAKRLNLQPGQKVLDLTAGMAAPSVELAKSGAYVVAYDFSRGMLKAGAHRDVPKVCGDGMKLSFPGSTFDAVTISFGLHNIVDYKVGLAELARVTKPGGQLTVYEFSIPVVLVFSTFYKEYLMRVLPQIAKAVSSDPEAYVYLAESIRAWSSQLQLVRDINASGWEDTGWQNLTPGIAALHLVTKPA